MKTRRKPIMNKPDKIESILKGCAYAIVVCWVILCFGLYTGCQPPFPPCSQSETNTERCNGVIIEKCNGENWYPNIYCDEVSFDGVSEPQTCVQHVDGDVDCGVR